MLYCPKCKFEYKSGFNICPDCGTELIEKAQDKPGKRRFGRVFYELTAIALIAPWLAYFMTAGAMLIVSKIAPEPIIATIVLCIIPIALVLAAVAYGRRRIGTIDIVTAFFGLLVGCIVQFILCFILTLIGIAHEPWKVIFWFPAAVIYATFCVAVALVGSLESHND